ncbi:M13 family metallopeptidase [Actinobacillus pleuropneumoniae]|uniref:Metallopeptidase n=1 Tax=Actinobacillus pleuropneumoniae TaxID=715 RepID=A0A3S4YKY5_ACTPL|nr:M13 family metallopeptidase [Actinobacillus pleuropneumoniae]EFL79306.1 neutral endopeptidase [Actinobacillus pleuropneumoniae serovar 2 str. 4226]EFM86642.1 Neutral endopeptidase [Actinobacillus pleuropneumoniae serovar 2 str. S1536]MEE3618256.1 M13 family metallopeptidase [Actinobacillus pleuropneumoniae]UKH08202.1 M13 family metallopeptidase [Actinobacillus pleuropneumoniae]UKH46631.1 M13 family peptidase [Actinobacillus pleuropneumoniae serovar 2 str. S1536]
MAKKFLLSLATLSLGLAGCSTTGYQSTLTEGVDNTVAPQQDFYRFVNGKWLAKAQIPADRTSWGTLAELNELNEQRSIKFLQAVISEPKFANDAKAQRLKAVYETYTDLNAREQAGLTPIAKDIEKIKQLKTFADLKRYLIEETKAGNEVLFGWSVFAHLKNSRQNGVYLSNVDLGLSNDYFQKDTPENRATLKLYQDYIEQILGYAKVTNPAAKAKAIVAYEKAIAKTLFTNEEDRDIQKRYNPTNLTQLKKLSKNIDLAQYLKAVGVETDEVILYEPRYFQALDQLINPQNLAVIKDYLLFRTLSDNAPYLNKEMDDVRFEFYGKKLVGQKQQRPLEKRALATINSWLGQEFAQFYVAKFFPQSAKNDVLEMAKYLVKAYHHRIDNLAWMSAETKQKAKAKLDKFIVEVGYPNKWRDYSNLTLKTVAQGGTLYANMQQIAKWGYDYNLAKVGKPVDLNEWGMLPQVVNASYSPLMNRIVFPAGILQAPLYSQQADPAVNFGAIGAIIGHEITHGFDDSGSKFDGEGNLKDWWTADDRKKFEALADKLVAQFDQFKVAPKVFVNGRFTLGENIADLGGLSIAYDALKLYEQDHGISPTIENFTSDQRFFMSWTRSWRHKATVQALTHQVKSDPHAPGQFRAYAPVLNISGFHRAFGTKAGDKMYRNEAERIRIW